MKIGPREGYSLSEQCLGKQDPLRKEVGEEGGVSQIQFWVEGKTASSKSSHPQLSPMWSWTQIHAICVV